MAEVLTIRRATSKDYQEAREGDGIETEVGDAQCSSERSTVH